MAGWDYWKDDVKYAAYFLGPPLLVCTAYGCSIRPAMVLPGQMEFMWEYAADAIFQSAILYHAYKRDSHGDDANLRQGWRANQVSCRGVYPRSGAFDRRCSSIHVGTCRPIWRRTSDAQGFGVSYLTHSRTRSRMPSMSRTPSAKPLRTSSLGSSSSYLSKCGTSLG